MQAASGAFRSCSEHSLPNLQVPDVRRLLRPCVSIYETLPFLGKVAARLKVERGDGLSVVALLSDLTLRGAIRLTCKPSEGNR